MTHGRDCPTNPFFATNQEFDHPDNSLIDKRSRIHQTNVALYVFCQNVILWLVWRFAAYEQAASLMHDLIAAPRFPDFLTLPAYDRVLQQEGFAA